MDNHPQPIPDRRCEHPDGEVIAPRTECEIITPARPAAPVPALPDRFEPPISALGPLFRHRLERIRSCRVNYVVDVNTRPTERVLGGYYRSRRLVRIYAHDRVEGRRPLEELFDTFLHEVAHHLEYTEPQSFGSRGGCRRIRGLMHSRLFWRILGELKWRWAELQTPRPSRRPSTTGPEAGAPNLGSL
jgi:hypothetical protein